MCLDVPMSGATLDLHDIAARVTRTIVGVSVDGYDPWYLPFPGMGPDDALGAIFDNRFTVIVASHAPIVHQRAQRARDDNQRISHGPIAREAPATKARSPLLSYTGTRARRRARAAPAWGVEGHRRSRMSWPARRVSSSTPVAITPERR